MNKSSKDKSPKLIFKGQISMNKSSRTISDFQVPRQRSPLVTFHQDQGREAPWLHSIKIEVEKLLGSHNSRLRQRSLPIIPCFEVEKALGYLPSRMRQRSLLVTFHQDQGREAPWTPLLKIEVEEPLNCPKFRGQEAPWLPSIKIKVEKPFDQPLTFRQR